MLKYCRRPALLAASIVCGGLALLALSAPLIQHIGGFPHGEGVYRFLSPICHQFPTRSLWVYDRPMGLCARCVSGYLGVFGAATWLRLSGGYRKRLTLGALLLAITLIDPIIQLNTAYESTNIVRVLSGTVGGVAIALIVLPVYLILSEE